MIKKTQEALFKDIFEQNYEKLCSVAFAIVKDQDDSRDVVQQVLCEFWDYRERWPEIQSYNAYLYTAVYRCSLTLHKKSIAFKNERQLSKTVNPSYQQVDTLAYQELEKLIFNTINDLPPKCKEIFLLSREDELSYKEIAAILNISVKTVEAQMGIALKRFRATFEHNNKDTLFFFIFL
ncbi:MAG: RNA polymerase sigma-70 factor [Cytophagia bacterium]|nr:RNA polymerase sigma-70 factor [Cytophagia bacterium]